MIESEIMWLYKYSIMYNHGETNEYTVILVSDNIRDLISLIVDREMVDPIGDASKWFEIGEFLWVSRKDENCHHLFDIHEQDLAVKFGYDVQEQYWKCEFKNDCPESVMGADEIMFRFEETIKRLHPEDEGISGSVLGQALYESHHVQNAIREKKREKDMHDAQEFDAGIGAIEEIVKREEKE